MPKSAYPTQEAIPSCRPPFDNVVLEDAIEALRDIENFNYSQKFINETHDASFRTNAEKAILWLKTRSDAREEFSK